MPLNTSQPINVSDIVMITGYGNDKFMTCRGWFTYNSSRRNGWYFKRIPDGYIVPDFEVDLNDVTVVSSSTSQCCPPHHPGHPGPPPANPENVNGAFVTVDTVEERNNLCVPFPPNGKIVRVNDVRGEVKYYIWNAEELKWDDFEFEPSSLVVSGISDLDKRVTQLEDEDWVYLSDVTSATA